MSKDRSGKDARPKREISIRIRLGPKKMIYIYSDGSSTGRSDGPFGWGYVIVKDDKIINQGYGGDKIGTNNQGELLGALYGLSYFMFSSAPIKDEITLISDSKYVLGMATGKFTPKKNVELCKLLKATYSNLNCKSEWVAGHSGNKYNDLADSLAKKGKNEHSK